MNIEKDLRQIALDGWNARSQISNNSTATSDRSYFSFDGWWNDYKKRIFGLGMFVNLNNE